MKPRARKRKVLILGATSAIARATAAAFAVKGDILFLAARDEDEVSRIASDLNVRHSVHTAYGKFDITDTDSHAGFIHQVIDRLGGLDGVVLAAGFMAGQDAAELDFALVEKTIRVNYLGAVSILDCCVAPLKEQQQGFIIGISSVAGDRGRQSNFYYGSAKGALTLYLQGLRNRLAGQGVRVLTVKPGFVDTAMTYGLKGMFLVATPESVGNRIVRALDKRADIIYVPWFWRYIMIIIGHIPERIFKRMKL